MSNWDNAPLDNGFKFEGSLATNHRAGTNLVLAYTFFPGKSWLSVESRNLIDLISDTDRNGKRKADLLVSIDPHGLGLDREFRLLKSNPKNYDRKLRIHVFTNRTGTNWDKTIVFHQIEVKDSKPGKWSRGVPFTRRSIQVPLPNLVYTIKYNDLEVL